MGVEACDLEPIHNQIVFQFIEDTTNGKFNQKTEGGLIVVDNKDKQVDYARWVRVLEVGPSVDEDIDVGDVVLVNALQWTNAFTFESEPHWITTDTEVLAILGDEDDAPGEIKHFL